MQKLMAAKINGFTVYLANIVYCTKNNWLLDAMGQKSLKQSLQRSTATNRLMLSTYWQYIWIPTLCCGFCSISSTSPKTASTWKTSGITEQCFQTQQLWHHHSSVIFRVFLETQSTSAKANSIYAYSGSNNCTVTYPALMPINYINMLA